MAAGRSESSIGEALLERYRIDRDAGRVDSGRAIAIEATDKRTDVGVMLEIHTALTSSEDRARFLRHSNLLGRLESDHVLRILDAGTLSDGTPYVVRERGERTLADEIAEREVIPPQEAVAFVLEICESLAEAHALEMAHGELSLDAVHLAKDAKGNRIAKLRWSFGATMTKATREDVSRDLAAVGEILRRAVSGQTDVEGDGAATMPTDLAVAVARSTTTDERARFRNVADLSAALSRQAPPKHQSARKVAYFLSKAGVIGGFPSARVVPPLEGIDEAWFEPPTSDPPPITKPHVHPSALSVMAWLVAASCLSAMLFALVRSVTTDSELDAATGETTLTSDVRDVRDDFPLEDLEHEPVPRAELDVASATAMTVPAALTYAASAERELDTEVVIDRYGDRYGDRYDDDRPGFGFSH